MQTLRQLFHPDIVWHAPGRNQLAGDHRGVDAVLGYFGRTMELTGGAFTVGVHDVVANDEHTIGRPGQRRAVCPSRRAGMASLGDFDRRHLVETLRAPLRAVGRVALAAMFITGGADALVNPGPQANEAAELGVPLLVMAERPVRRR